MAKGPFVDVFSSENRTNIPVYPLDVFVVTEHGLEQLHGASTHLPPEALEVLVLTDGKATVGDIEGKLPNLPPETVRDTLRALLGAGLVRAATIAESEGLDFSDFFAATAEQPEPSADTKASAEREAGTGTPRLEREGYYVSIARQAMQPRAPGGAPINALLVEDDPDVSTLVARLLEKQAFKVSVAATRDEVIARLRAKPAPDLVILDVHLPDANGFDILQRLKSHPGLKSVPVIMLTAEANRESVMRGIAGGADGYITKPFETASLLAGVKAVLGIAA
ncbi:MAG: response regulator [Betaproteobacteria bacterium]|nr:response regulator [Betaproteobacteria bacterium]